MPERPAFIPYAERAIRFHGIRNSSGFRLKLYSIRYGSGEIDWPRFEPALADACAALPEPAETAHRPGVGFLIAHQGQGDYVVLGWWDNENELPLRVFVRDDSKWRAAMGGESICVWDLQVIWHERQAYVRTFLNADCVDPVNAYLRDALQQ